MKKAIIIPLLFLTIHTASAQLSVGPKINLGAGRISSKNLKDNLDYRKNFKKDITEWDVKSKSGFTAGFGLFAQYSINEQLSVLGELSYNRLKNRILINYIENDLDGSGDGDIKTISSEAILRIGFVSLPLLVKYSMGRETPIYFLAGLGFDFTGLPEIESFETKVTEEYENHFLREVKTENERAIAQLNAFKTSRAKFTLGAGTAIDLNGRDLNLDLRFHLPLTRSEMFSISGVFDDNTYKNNEHFFAEHKFEAEMEAPQFPLNDFKMGSIELSVAYSLFTK